MKDRPSEDAAYLRCALRLAAKARGQTSPNPLVGAVVVARNRIVGQGFHRRAGEPHAEALALQAAGSRARGATLYVTLEPCCHTAKRTPPCVPLVLASGVQRVVIGMPDPNPQVRGRGIARLRHAGLDVTVGILRAEAERLNEIYCHWVRTGRPFVILKAAMTLDGKIAPASGASRWISGLEARREVHRWRSRVDAVMVGIGTVLQDDPRLTARLGPKPRRQPLRVILDSRLRIPPTAHVLTGRVGDTMIATTDQAPKDRIDQCRALGATVLILPEEHGRVALAACLRALGRRGVTSILLEGGGEVHASALHGALVNRVLLYVAPLLLGGQDARSVIGGRSPGSLAGAWPLKDVRIRKLGRDLRVEACLAGPPSQRSSRTRSDTN